MIKNECPIGTRRILGTKFHLLSHMLSQSMGEITLAPCLTVLPRYSRVSSCVLQSDLLVFKFFISLVNNSDHGSYNILADPELADPKS